MSDDRPPVSGEPSTEFWFAQGTLIHGRDRGGIDIGPLIGEARTEASARSLVEEHNAMVRKARATPPSLDAERLKRAMAMWAEESEIDLILPEDAEVVADEYARLTSKEERP